MPYPATVDFGATARNWQVIYTTTQTGISATFDSPALQVGTFSELLLIYNLSAFTGTSVTFKIRAQDSFSNLTTIVATSALSATALSSLATPSTTPFGNIVVLEATAVSVTSMTFTWTLIGK